MADSADKLLMQAEKLANGKRGNSEVEKPGYIRHRIRGWRDAELHRKVIELYSRAVELQAAGPDRLGFARFRRGLEHLHAGDLDLAAADLAVLQAMGSSYGGGSFPIMLALAQGDRKKAQALLDLINAANKAKGHPRSKLSDYEY